MNLVVEDLTYIEVKGLSQMVNLFSGMAEYSGKESLKTVCQKVQKAISEQTDVGKIDTIVDSITNEYEL